MTATELISGLAACGAWMGAAESTPPAARSAEVATWAAPMAQYRLRLQPWLRLRLRLQLRPGPKEFSPISPLISPLVTAVGATQARVREIMKCMVGAGAF